MITRLLDGAILLAVLTQAVSLTDLFLSAKQKKRIEGWCDEITLRLSYLKTIEWLQRWLTASRRANVAGVLFWVVGAVAILAPPALILYALFADGFWLAVGLAVLYLILQGWSWGIVSKVFESVSTKVFDILGKIRGIWRFILVYISFMLSGAVIVILAGIVLGSIIEFLGWDERDPPFYFRYALFYVGNLYVGLIVTWVLLFIDGLFTLIGAALVWVASLLVAVARGFMWRVAGYPKGPLAALTLVAGSILAIIRFATK